MRRSFIYFICLAVAFSAGADIIDDAQDLINSGDYEAAKSILANNLESLPKTTIPRATYMIGECDFYLDNIPEAKKNLLSAKAKGIYDANLYLGRIAFLDYNFDEASELYSAYSTALRKAKKEPAEELEEYESQLSDAKSFLDRVEKIAVIDSIAVKRDDFFKAYRLPASAGSLRPGASFPIKELRDEIDCYFSNEGEDFMMWTQTDSLGYDKIREAIKLTDGTWSEPTSTLVETAADSDIAYPFMMADGVTLYFASDGDGSIGGYDIFVATRDASTGEYLQPQNIGMPYNSPYDDYLLAIDEQNGVGWWATDRNQLGDYVTVYVYVVNDLRKNYDPDSDNVTEMAKISDYRSTWGDDADYSELLSTINSITPDTEKKKADFYFPVSGGRIFTTFADFKTSATKSAMKSYIEASNNLEADLGKLREMRKRYHISPSKSLASEILSVEKKTERQRESLKKLKSEVYRQIAAE